ncbi:MAG: hypothetical protein JNK05_02450 [Myxococcales bacterium]|nr:hypothetical protein [Myxococcales bacterium]
MRTQFSMSVLGALIVASIAGCTRSDGAATNAASASDNAAASTSSSGQSAAPAPIAPVPIVPLQLVANNADSAVAAELNADGTVHARGAIVARFDGARFTDSSGAEVLRIAPDGALSSPSRPDTGARMDANGDVQTRASRIVVTPDGAIEERHDDGRVERAPVRFVTIPEGARRAAGAMAMLVLAMPAELRASGAEATDVSMDASVPASSADAAVEAAVDAGRRRRR